MDTSAAAAAPSHIAHYILARKRRQHSNGAVHTFVEYHGIREKLPVTESTQLNRSKKTREMKIREPPFNVMPICITAISMQYPSNLPCMIKERKRRQKRYEDITE